jgi:cupin fold WbuC family metalloprotein
MKIEKITDSGTTLAIIIRSGDWEPGLNFISASEDLQQVGLWHYADGTRLTPHIHLLNPRSVPHTQEVVFVKQGKVRANVYSEDRKPVQSVELKTGDFMVMLKGGHGYDILENNTQVLEVKNGPFTSVEKDRERF